MVGTHKIWDFMRLISHSVKNRLHEINITFYGQLKNKTCSADCS